MKRIFILIGVLISFSISAQEYVSFPTENAEWKAMITRVSYLFAMPPDNIQYDYYDYHYYLNGDTIIDSKKYVKVYVDEKKKPFGFFREEDKRIYYQGSLGMGMWTNEIILYDFNKNVGDTIHWDINKFYTFVVTKIDSVKIDNQYRKRFTLKEANEYYGETDQIIEGIGSVKNGLFGGLTMGRYVTDTEYFWNFKSFSQNGKMLFEKCDALYDYSDVTFAPVGASWYYDYGIVNHSTNELDDDYLKLEVIGEEMINGRLCSRTGYSFNTSICYSGSGYIYENYTKDTVFYAVEDKFIPIYCWKAEVGESWKIDLSLFKPVPPEYQYLVVSVDSVKCINILGKTLREQYVSYYYEGMEAYKVNSKIIQGIGDVSYFYYFQKFGILTCDELAFNRGLRCFIHPYLGTYKFTDKECDYRTSIENQEIDDVEICLSESNQVVVKSKVDLIESISVINYSGKNIYDLINQNIQYLTIPPMKKGAYIIQVATKSGTTINRKILIY